MGINKPPAYVHPNKRKRAAQPEEAITVGERPEDRQIAVKAKKPRAAIEKISSQQLTAGKKTVLLRLAAHPPSEGEFEFYDQLRASGLSSKDATLALLRQGNEKLAKVANLSTSKFEVLSYKHEEGVVVTSRKVSDQLLADLKAGLDPHGVLTTRALAIKIGEAVLALTVKERNTG